MTTRARRASILLVCVAVILAGCSEGDADTTGSEPEPSAADDPAGGSEPDRGLAREVTGDDVSRAPAPPIDVTVQIDDSDVVLRWSRPAGSDDDTYVIGRDGREVGRTPDTEYIDIGVEHGTYDYQVISIGPDGAWSDPVDVPVEVGGPDRFPPSTPWGVEIEIGNGRVVVSWEESVDDQGVAGYLVHRDGQLQAWVTDDLRFVDSDVEAGHTYRYRIEARDHAGRVSAPAGGLASSGPIDSTAPSAPEIVDVMVEGGQITIDWQDSVDDGELWGYLVHRDGVFLGWVAGASEIVDSVDPGSDHLYVIRAQDVAGNNSLPSELVEIVSAG
jgi:hypothetical protein